MQMPTSQHSHCPFHPKEGTLVVCVLRIQWGSHRKFVVNIECVWEATSLAILKTDQEESCKTGCSEQWVDIQVTALCSD